MAESGQPNLDVVDEFLSSVATVDFPDECPPNPAEEPPPPQIDWQVSATQIVRPSTAPAKRKALDDPRGFRFDDPRRSSVTASQAKGLKLNVPPAIPTIATAASDSAGSGSPVAAPAAAAPSHPSAYVGSRSFETAPWRAAAAAPSKADVDSSSSGAAPSRPTAAAAAPTAAAPTSAAPTSAAPTPAARMCAPYPPTAVVRQTGAEVSTEGTAADTADPKWDWVWQAARYDPKKKKSGGDNRDYWAAYWRVKGKSKGGCKGLLKEFTAKFKPPQGSGGVSYHQPGCKAGLPGEICNCRDAPAALAIAAKAGKGKIAGKTRAEPPPGKGKGRGIELV